MIRIFDLLLSLLGLIITIPVFIIIYLVNIFDANDLIFCQERVGRKQKPFILFKFRTMKIDTISIASHLVDAGAITPIGAFLRRTKLDELPQLWNVLKGDMSLVGPRPCLFSQDELIEERAKYKIFDARPGITGLAQISNIDMSTPRLLAQTDALMLRGLTLKSYFIYIFKTILGGGAGDVVSKK
jgi:O-antigen biosynthesis protein WbqP